jgi:hypothetical protein
MAKAKQATPVQEETKQIVLTQEQFDKLRLIQDTIDTETSTLKETIGDTDLKPIELGFNIGSAHASLYDACNQLENLLDTIDPVEEIDWTWDDEDKN